jgi:hypothetical protein
VVDALTLPLTRVDRRIMVTALDYSFFQLLIFSMHAVDALTLPLTRVNRRIMITALDYAFWQLFIF